MGICEPIVLIEKLTYTLIKLFSYKRVFIFYYLIIYFKRYYKDIFVIFAND